MVKQKYLNVVFSILRLEPSKFCLHHTCIGICVYGWITIHMTVYIHAQQEKLWNTKDLVTV